MNRSLTDVLVERERLLARCGQQRSELARAARGLAGPASIVDRIAAGGRYVARHPLALAGIVAALFAFRGRSILGMAARGIGMWRLVRRVQSLVRLLQY